MDLHVVLHPVLFYDSEMSVHFIYHVFVIMDASLAKRICVFKFSICCSLLKEVMEDMD